MQLMFLISVACELIASITRCSVMSYPYLMCPSPWAFRQRTGAVRWEVQRYYAAEVARYWHFIHAGWVDRMASRASLMDDGLSPYSRSRDMALRFRKSFKIAPGVRINLSKSGLSTSVGGKGFTANLSKRGTRVTAGIPGSGLSASKLYSSGRKETLQAAPVPMWAHVVTWLMIAGVLWWIFS